MTRQFAQILLAVWNVNVQKAYLVMDFCHVMILMNALRSVSKLPESGIREPESIGPKISETNIRRHIIVIQWPIA